jgi:hypothetical protein
VASASVLHQTAEILPTLTSAHRHSNHGRILVEKLPDASQGPAMLGMNG